MREGEDAGGRWVEQLLHLWGRGVEEDADCWVSKTIGVFCGGGRRRRVLGE